jgi:hypothetical protein
MIWRTGLRIWWRNIYTSLTVEPLLFQTRYIIIHSYDSETMLYTLGYPNSQNFSSLQKRSIDALMAQMRIFFSNILNNINLQKEKYYQTVFYLVLKLVGIYIDVEVNTGFGRIDAVMQSGERIYHR